MAGRSPGRAGRRRGAGTSHHAVFGDSCPAASTPRTLPPPGWVKRLGSTHTRGVSPQGLCPASSPGAVTGAAHNLPAGLFRGWRRLPRRRGPAGTELVRVAVPGARRGAERRVSAPGQRQRREPPPRPRTALPGPALPALPAAAARLCNTGPPRSPSASCRFEPRP